MFLLNARQPKMSSKIWLDIKQKKLTIKNLWKEENKREEDFFSRISFLAHRIADNQVDEPSIRLSVQTDGDTEGWRCLPTAPPPPAPGPANGHLSQSHNSSGGRCQRRDEICMKTRMFSTPGPALINDSIQRRLAAEYIYYTSSASTSQFYAFWVSNPNTPSQSHPLHLPPSHTALQWGNTKIVFKKLKAKGSTSASIGSFFFFFLLMLLLPCFLNVFLGPPHR